MKIQVEIAEREAALVRLFTTSTSEDDNTQARLTVESLVIMLLEDVALMLQRPGCWEAESMRQLLSSHGYEDASYGPIDGSLS